MPTLYPELFQPIRIGPMELRNRIVAPPMVQVRSIVSREGIAWYRRLAAGGAGLVIVEATGVPRFGVDLTATSLRPLVKAIHTAGAKAAIQLFPIRCRLCPSRCYLPLRRV
jgi:2,4-dienoyl-CoA reductase-like NADH-dependent reductase (Old Yellow Enzyme family)